ncbi:Sel1 domain protein repeat-containing protein [Seminavis robusta]|uniref:Sel1 domain protein repeat-containing protein n=1 Tax=Seminavis robusta TaxID=568900 RepID=A0A9N8HQP8_9STRA|nr:Sel1 domain protein repeat-containing protein [Seminavis robusta]|eukprot:Sro1311_g261780.1 Sel1 domain protein repeat-containing protein (580) ;mRNA; f:25482-27926
MADQQEQNDEESNRIRLYRQQMIKAIAEGLADSSASSRFFSHFDTLPVAHRIASFLPLPTTFLQSQLCQFVGGTINNSTTCTSSSDAERYARELLRVGLWLGTLEHCVQMEGGSFWHRYAPRKPWLQKRDRCETVWEFTPVLHAGVHLRITMDDNKDHLLTNTESSSGDDCVLVNLILEDELKAGHFICLREWLNGLFNSNKIHCQKNDSGPAVQAILQIESFSADHVHLRVVANPYNGDCGFQNHPAFMVFYQQGWYCQNLESMLLDTTTNNTDEVDWLRQSWEIPQISRGQLLQKKGTSLKGGAIATERSKGIEKKMASNRDQRLRAKRQKKSLADDLICPISLELPWEPVMAEDARIYDRSFIEEHFNTHTGDLKSPMTQQKMGTKLLPAIQTRNHIEALIEAGAIDGDLAAKWKEKVNQAKQMDTLVKKAEAGDMDAMYGVGHRYYNGVHGVKKDEKKACEWFKRARSAGCVKGTAMMAWCYLGGWGAPKQQSLGLIHLTNAASQGSNVAAYHLGMAFANGTFDLRVDIAEAIYWLVKAIGDCPHDHLSDSAKKEAGKELRDLIDHSLRAMIETS